MGHDPWYRTADMLPPLRAHVRVTWVGRVFEAIRAVHPKKKKYCWATMDDGEIVYLPPKGRSKLWGDNPELWQPADPNRWPYDLPEPVVSPKEGITEDSRNPRPEPHTNALWWRDATLVTYSEPGRITLEEAEARLMRALNTGWRISKDLPKSPTNADVLNKIAALKWTPDDDEEAQVIDKDWRPPFEPTGKDQDDYLTAMAWFVSLNPPELWPKKRRMESFNRSQYALVYRALDPPASWAYMANKWSTTPDRAKRIYENALDNIWRAANKQTVLRHVEVADQIGLLRERNRRAKQKDNDR